MVDGGSADPPDPRLSDSHDCCNFTCVHLLKIVVHDNITFAIRELKNCIDDPLALLDNQKGEERIVLRPGRVKHIYLVPLRTLVSGFVEGRDFSGSKLL